MFWENLTREESDQYMAIRKELRPYEMWCSLSKNQKAKVSEVQCPSDTDLILLENLSMKGWCML